jgi:hypothetical protein
MNLGEARSLVRLYINEPRAAHWTDAQLNTLIQLSNVEVYHQIVAQSPDMFTHFGQFLIPAGTWQFDFADSQIFGSTSGIKNGPALQVLGVSVSNKKFVLQTGENGFGYPNCDFQVLQPATRMNDLLTHSRNADGYTAGVNNQYPTTYKTYGGRRIALNPVAQQSFYLWLWFVPNVVTPTGDTDQLLLAGFVTSPSAAWYLEGNEKQFDELVPLLAAIKAKASVGDQDDGLAALYRARLDSMKNVIGLSLQRQTPQTIMGNQVGR